jgi:hypothetical protein
MAQTHRRSSWFLPTVLSTTAGAVDVMPLAYHDPSIRKRSMSHVLVPPAETVEAIVTGPTSGFACCAALALLRHRSGRGF